MREVAIAGAGIGGLAAALALARIGCRVVVFERAAAMGEVGAGVQISPNASGALARLGILDDLQSVAVEPAEVLIRRGRDGATLARVPLGASARARYGSPALVVLRADLQAALLARAACEPAITIDLGDEVTGFETQGGGVTPRVSDRPATRFDGLIAADGIRSVLRRLVTGASVDDARPARRTAWRSLLDGAAVDADARVARSNLWLGPRAHIVHYPVDGGRRVNVVAITDEVMDSAGDDLWSSPGDPAALRRHFAGWAEPVRRLLDTAPGWRRWPLFDRPPLACWSRGPVVLLGDAAHPMLPFLAQGAAQAIEDALALADAVAAAPADLPTAFLRYADARRARTARVQSESARQARIYHLRRPASLARDLALRSLGPERLAARYDWLYRPQLHSG